MRESGSCEEGVPGQPRHRKAAGPGGEDNQDKKEIPIRQESEDFVPELLTPVPRRSRSLFGWRRREAAQAQEEQPGTPRRRSKTPGTMTTLREESEGERRGREGTAQEERGRSYLPWRGPVRRENSAEGLEEGPARREGRPKDKDASILPAFLRRATSKDNRSRTQRTAPHAGDSPATDGLAASPMSEAQGSGVCSPSEDASTKTASSSMPFTFFRAPWSGKRESSVPSRSEPGGEREGEITPVVLPGTAEGDARDPVSPQQSDAVHEDIQEETEVDEDKLTDEEKAALTWERYRAQNRSLVGDVFEGQLRSQLRCSCGHNSSTFEPFRYLSVPIPANHSDSFELKVVFFPALSSERPALSRFSVSVPKSSSAKRLQLSLARRLPVSLSAVLLAEVYRSRIHRYLDPNLPLSDVRAEDQLFAFEVPQNTQDLCDYQQRLLSDKTLLEEQLA
ncbi:unnamed protein product [Effrenium voratum]|uniref:Uncharacterized protein n=1 Tax=Effrenium voratum TaxID=2562239 RepID=A0AA36HRE7_9DINO|nr:unnamed protein product [Effrenium voratum]